jgi:hypothetical protein
MQQITKNESSHNLTIQNGEPVLILKLDEYNKLIKEHSDLLLRNSELTNDKKILQTDILGKNITIDELKKENEELRNRIKELENDVLLLKQKNEKKENNALYGKYIIAIQDLNHIDKLEKKISKNKLLYNLRYERRSDCHYIDECYDIDEINKRRIILYDKIINIPPFVFNKINSRFPDLIEEIKPYIKNQECVISDDDNERINEWWE